MDITKLDPAKKHVLIVPSYYRAQAVCVNDINGKPSAIPYIDFLMEAVYKSKKDGSVLIIPEMDDKPIRVYEMEYSDTLDIQVYDEGVVEEKCTCPESCGSVCKGTCGCQKCHDDYNDFLSVE